MNADRRVARNALFFKGRLVEHDVDTCVILQEVDYVAQWSFDKLKRDRIAKLLVNLLLRRTGHCEVDSSPLLAALAHFLPPIGVWVFNRWFIGERNM